MNPAALFVANLPVIDRVIDRVCRRANVYNADAEDFASQAKLALIENDYAILRKWEGGSLAAFLAIVLQRMMIDEWRARGRWVPSAEARRMGSAAVALETLIARDRRSPAEALHAVSALHPSISSAELERLAASLPHRDPPRRTVPMPDDAAEVIAAPHGADERARDADAQRLGDRAGDLVRHALAAMPLEDRMLLRFRFASSMSIADIARVMNVPQRPLYRRLEALLSRLKQQLADAGLDAAALAEVIGCPATRIDFGWKSDEPLPSSDYEKAETAGEHGS